MIPRDTKEQIDSYVRDGVPLGSFLYAVMSNNLMEAFHRADSTNTAFMKDILSYVFNKTPAICHGSVQAVEEWLNYKRKTNDTRNQ